MAPADFGPLAGSDIPLTALVGDDQMPVRFTIAKAGANMLVKKNQKIRVICRDDLSTITKFRAMVQGIYVDK